MPTSELYRELTVLVQRRDSEFVSGDETKRKETEEEISEVRQLLLEQFERQVV